jgi:diaminopimelate decarboxylase
MFGRNFPDSAAVNERGHLQIGGCDVVDLAREFGTPLYVMDEVTLRNRCRDYLHSFRLHYPNIEIIYASKALCAAGISEVIANEGLGFDVSSGGELFTVLKAGADPRKIYFHGNNKSLREMEEGLKAGIGHFVVDHAAELEKLDALTQKLKVKTSVLIRVNPGIEAHTHEFIQTGKIDSKFGMQIADLENLIPRVRKMMFVEFSGFHAHIGSQILDVSPFVAEAEFLLKLTDQFGAAEMNLGGGLGIAYLDQHEPPSIGHFAAEISKVIKNRTTAKLILEPGRSIVGGAGVTLYTVGGIKDISGIRKYLFVDGGMADNPRPILYEAKYAALLGNKPEAGKDDLVTIAGRFCESGDILIKDLRLPKAEPGDILVVLCTGAYNYSMASNYNRVGRPAMVLANNGDAAMVVKRESYEDIIINDAF